MKRLKAIFGKTSIPTKKEKQEANSPNFLSSVDVVTASLNPIYFPKRKKLKGWLKEQRRLNPKKYGRKR